jgi:hypothetical protein
MIRGATLLLAIALAIALSACSVSTEDPSANSAAVSGVDAEYYTRVVEKAGADPSAGVTVLGIRRAGRTEMLFDDSFVVLRAGVAVVVAGSTHPWFTHSSSAPDVDGDGDGDVGMIRPGVYRVVPRAAAQDISGLPTFHVLNKDGSEGLPGWRDTNHDGVYDEAERTASEARGDKMTAVLFHYEGPGAPPAIGCQVTGRPDLTKFVEAAGGRDTTFTYVLVDAADLPPPS